MGKKSSQGGKGKRKENGPANLRYKQAMRWLTNKDKAIARDKREKAKIAASPKKARVKAARASRQEARRHA